MHGTSKIVAAYLIVITIVRKRPRKAEKNASKKVLFDVLRTQRNASLFTTKIKHGASRLSIPIAVLRLVRCYRVVLPLANGSMPK